MTLKRFNPFSRHDWEKAGDKIEDAAEQVGDAFKDTAEDAGKKLQPLAEQAFDAAEEAVKKALQHLVAVAAKGTLNQAVDLIQIAAPDSIKLKILAVFVVIDDIEDRIDTLQKWANKPPTSKKALKRMIRDLGAHVLRHRSGPAGGPADRFERCDRGRIFRHLEHRPLPTAVRRPD